MMKTQKRKKKGVQQKNSTMIKKNILSVEKKSSINMS